MDTFSGELRHLRRAAGLRQQDVVQALGGAVARSTLANVESGRQRPTHALMAAISATWPEWAEKLQPHFERSQGPAPQPSAEPSGWPHDGPYLVDRIHYVFNFRQHRWPHEIISVRKVRTVQDASQEFGLGRNLQGSKEGFTMESLWGGELILHRSGDYRCRFPAPLLRGERHEFAIRTWIAQERPERDATFQFSLPTQWAEITLNFFGDIPGHVFEFGDSPTPHPTATPRPVPIVAGRAHVSIDKPTVGQFYGLMWRW